MKTLKHWALAVCAMLVGFGTLQAEGKDEKKNKEQTVYIFGISTAFSDSLVHITDVQELKGAGLVSKNGFIEARSIYSYQLKQYLENGANLPNRTCTVFFAKKKNKIDKKYAKLKERYRAMKGMALRPIGLAEFSFEKYEGGE